MFEGEQYLSMSAAELREFVDEICAEGSATLVCWGRAVDRPGRSDERRDGSVRLYEAPHRAFFLAKPHWLQDAGRNFRARVRGVPALDHYPIHTGASTGRIVRRAGIEAAATPCGRSIGEAAFAPIGRRDSPGSRRLAVVSTPEKA